MNIEEIIRRIQMVKKKLNKYSLINYIGKSNVLLFSTKSSIIIYYRYFLLRNL
jgi:hypothetical protein